MSNGKKTVLLAALLLIPLLSACGPIIRPGQEEAEGSESVDPQIALQLTMEAMPTQTPLVITEEVLREVTRISEVEVPVSETPTPPGETPEASPTVEGLQLTRLADTLTAIVVSSTPTAGTPDGEGGGLGKEDLSSTPTPTAGPCHVMRFVYDETIPDGTRLDPGEYFTKVWRVQNVGSCTWVPGYALVFYDGAQMNADPSKALLTEVKPGGYVNFSINMRAPFTPGTYRGYWIMSSPSDELFGWGPDHDEPIWVEIMVRGNTPTPAE